MKRSVLPLAVLGLLVAAPAFAPPAFAQGLAKGQTLRESDLAPVKDVLVAAQQRLSQMGYSAEPTGQFDAQTRNNVLAFQADHGLRPTGNIDLETLAALGVDVNSGRAVAAAPMDREPGRQYAMLDSTTAARANTSIGESKFKNPHIPILRFDPSMSSPQYMGQGYPIENMTGVPQPTEHFAVGQVGALPAGTFIDTVNGGVWN